MNRILYCPKYGAKHELIGTEGGKGPVILILFREPFSIYLAIRTPWGWIRTMRGGMRAK